MVRDIKDVIGILMRVADGGEVSQAELEDLGFDADGAGAVQAALNDAYIKLLEFAHDHEKRIGDHALDRVMRSALLQCLERIVSTYDREDQRS
jgi:rRNA-processing protein FCF1